MYFTMEVHVQTIFCLNISTAFEQVIVEQRNEGKREKETRERKEEEEKEGRERDRSRRQPKEGLIPGPSPTVGIIQCSEHRVPLISLDVGSIILVQALSGTTI